MADAEGMRDQALGTLAEWLPGYTFPESGPQDRISLVSEDVSGLVVAAESLGAYCSPRQQFRIEVTVTEVAKP